MDTVLNLENHSDEFLMSCVKEDSNSEKAFEILFERYQNRTINLISRFTIDRDRAQELTQEAFMKIFIHRERYITTAKFSTWFYAIAVNLAKNELRKRKRARDNTSLDKLADLTGDSCIFTADVLSKPDRKLQQREINERVEKALKKLPKKYQQVIWLRDIQEFSYSEIEEALGIPGGTVRSRINRGRTQLQENLFSMIKDGIEI